MRLPRAGFWSKDLITLPSGIQVPATSPLILSASRATDIPAFHSGWLLRRLQAGWLDWKNPFNGVVQTVTLHKVRAIVFWSKYPAPCSNLLDWLDEHSITYYFQFTLNDYEHCGLEPDLPPIAKRIDVFKTLSDRLGPQRVIWRFDPLILGKSLSLEQLLERVASLGKQLRQYTSKMVFSFADLNSYKKVSKRMSTKNSSNWCELSQQEMLDFAAALKELNYEWKLSLASCAEEIDLSPYGIAHNTCIDGALLKTIGSKDQELQTFLASRAGSRKDPGQRKLCGCIAAKDIGSYGTCAYSCAYCYAQ